MKDFKEAFAAPRMVALYAFIGDHTWFSVFEVSYSKLDENHRPMPEGQLREVPMENYVRISEPVKVDFASAGTEAMVRNAVEALTAQERKVVDELNKKLADIRERKQQLLALTHQP